MSHRAGPTDDTRDRIFASDCDGCAQISDTERRNIQYISDLVFHRVVRVFEMKIVGTVLKPIAKDLIDKFVLEMDGHSLRGRHVGLVAQEVLKRLDKYLHGDK